MERPTMNQIHLQIQLTLEQTQLRSLAELFRNVNSIEIHPEKQVFKEDEQAQPFLIHSRDAAKLLGISERTLWGMSHAEETPSPIRIGRNVRWSIEELRAWTRYGCPPRSRWNTIWQELNSGKLSEE